jgi:hypothetical protein
MKHLTVREMVLYKHGVGFFMRRGQTEEGTVTLTFRDSEINDVLKSLAVFDQAGGQVLGVYYQTPMDRNRRLSNGSITLGEDQALGDLINQLVGRQATAMFELEPETVQSVTGRVIGMDSSDDDPTHRFATIVSEDDAVHSIPLASLRWIKPLDEQARHDLHYFLDTEQGDDSLCIVNVRLSDGQHDLIVYYVAPAPTWRVSYRFVAEAAQDDDASGGQALLQGWGLFDNLLDEDLNDVKVTLVAGQPISFIYDLYESHIPERPTIQDESRVVSSPPEFKAEYATYTASGVTDEGDSYIPAKRAGKPRWGIARISDGKQSIIAERMQTAAPAQAETREAGAFFQYDVTTPVSVKRGASAMVPILNEMVKYESELLYNRDKLPDHPVASFRFENTTGLTLERGPVTVVEDSDYRGEAVVSFTKAGRQVILPYAVELGIRVVEDQATFTTTTGLKIKDAYAVFEEYRIQQTVYAIDNQTAEPRTVTVEAPITPYQELFDTPEPVAETTTERRWRVNIPARSKQTFIRKERRLSHRRTNLEDLTFDGLDQYLEKRWLDKPTVDSLKELLTAYDAVQQAEDRKAAIQKEREHIYSQQEQLRQNMSALNPQGDEAAFRKRIVDKLEATQDALEALEAERQTLDEQSVTLEAQMRAILAGFDDPPEAE